MLIIAIITAAIVIANLACLTIIWRKLQHLKTDNLDALLREQNQALRENLIERFAENRLQFEKSLHEFRHRFDERQMESLKTLQDTLRQNLRDISGKVEERLNEGFKKTTETFQDVIKRLALIDAAQQKITELSTNVVSLQEVLSDKKSRGAFGEVQLNALIRNVMPESSFSLQHEMSNKMRADCILFLPEPTGNVVIDAKFPLENYKQMTKPDISELEKAGYERQFKKDIKTHVQHISTKYIIPGETTDGAMMFIPAEAIFAEIHAHYPDLVEFAQKNNVWLVSPTTMMAVLTTARAVLKDAATRKHIHVIQEHLGGLAKDFARFEKRMDNLATHIRQAHEDVDQVNKSAKKITTRFGKIEKVELADQSEAVELIEDL